MSRIYIPVEFRRLVLARARWCCEYCLLHQDHTDFSHQVDHIIALKHKGLTVLENLALACLECNLNKGTDLATIDPLTGEVALLFHPRRQNWLEHFALADDTILGLTPTGRATAELLQFNVPVRIAERNHLIALGLFPPNWLG